MYQTHLFPIKAIRKKKLIPDNVWKILLSLEMWD